MSPSCLKQRFAFPALTLSAMLAMMISVVGSGNVANGAEPSPGEKLFALKLRPNELRVKEIDRDHPAGKTFGLFNRSAKHLMSNRIPWKAYGNKLTYYHAGRFQQPGRFQQFSRFKQFSQFGGKVIDDLIA